MYSAKRGLPAGHCRASPESHTGAFLGPWSACSCHLQDCLIFTKLSKAPVSYLQGLLQDPNRLSACICTFSLPFRWCLHLFLIQLGWSHISLSSCPGSKPLQLWPWLSFLCPNSKPRSTCFSPSHPLSCSVTTCGALSGVHTRACEPQELVSQQGALWLGHADTWALSAAPVGRILPTLKIPCLPAPPSVCISSFT